MKRDELVGRGGLKLRAAIARFGLGDRIRGAMAIDVGASTGGFTQVMLEGGAASVQAVDVGRGQMHETLRRDPRVQVREETDWKRLPLAELPGPYDFFTIDVSFVAARNMLRGLAFRLRPGAEGVVLVKPQFELPERLVKNGRAGEPEARRQALARFTEKAEELGFRVAGSVDSPVAGGEGTVEVLAHVRFEGRPANFPKRGEATSKTARGRRTAAPAPLTGDLSWFAVVTPGAEVVAAREAAALAGATSVKATPGGVELRGPLAVGMAANLHLRVPTRILLRLGEVRAREFGKLRHQLARLPWEAFLPEGAPLRIAVTTSRCRLYHTGALDENLRAAIADRTGTLPPQVEDLDTVLADPPERRQARVQATEGVASPRRPPSATGVGPWEGPQPLPRVMLRGVDDRWMVSVDSSGERLHRRGWRTESGAAPLRESLAAALLELADWRPGEALVDPMCGAGTLPIEACAMALGHAPGLQREFAFESWPGLSARERDRWLEQKQAAAAARRPRPGAAIVGRDRDAAVVAAAQRNAERAGVAAHVTFVEGALADATPPAAEGLFIANPPYGKRLGGRRDLPALYREMGNVLRRRFPGWRAAVVTPDARLASAFRLPVAAAHPVIHGGLRVTLLCFAPFAASS